MIDTLILIVAFVLFPAALAGAVVTRRHMDARRARDCRSLILAAVLAACAVGMFALRPRPVLLPSSSPLPAGGAPITAAALGRPTPTCSPLADSGAAATTTEDE